MTVRPWLLLSVLVLGARLAAADVDLTGRWIAHYSAFGFEAYECQDFVQTGTMLTFYSCDGPPSFRGIGTVDPVTGQFEVGTFTNGMAAPDSNTYTATTYVSVCHFPFGCQTEYPAVDGARCGVATFIPSCDVPGCGNGVVEPGEECDEGLENGFSGVCCTTACTFQPAGTLCYADGGSLSSVSSCDAGGTCLPPLNCGTCQRHDAPTYTCVADVRSDCRRPAVPSGRVSLTPDAVSWTWDHGAATGFIDFADPVTYVSYRLCVFADDGQGGTEVIATTPLPYGGTCGGKPCWRTDAASTLFRYRNNGGNGLRSVLLKSGGLSRAKIVLKGRGAALGLPASLAGVHAPVTVQLEHLNHDYCWASRFSTADVSDASRFRARRGE